MGFQILSESYGRRLPKITAEADSTDDLATLGIDFAEGSTCTVGEEEYVLDKVGGWVIRGSGGGGGGNSNVYCIPGDYADGDTISQEYLRAANSVMNEGGLAFLTTSGGDNGGVWICTTSIGCVSITGSSHTLDVDWETGEISLT